MRVSRTRKAKKKIKISAAILLIFFFLLYYYFSITFVLDSVGRFSSRKGEKVHLFFFWVPLTCTFIFFIFLKHLSLFQVRFCFFFPLRKNPSFGWRVFFFFFRFQTKAKNFIIIIITTKILMSDFDLVNSVMGCI